MSFYSVPNVYSALLGEDNIPSTMLPSTQSKMIPCTSQLKSVRTQSANLTPGALALWQIQTGSGTGFLKSNSLYLRGTIRIDGVVAGGTGSFRFNGPVEGITGVGEGLSKSTHSASSLIARLTVANGAQQISQLTNYNVWHDLLLTHATSSDYVNNDSSVYEYTGHVKTLSVANPIDATEGTLNFCIPIMSPIFCGQQSVPLFLLNSPLSLEILFNSLSDALVAGANTTINNYTISNAELVYEEIVVSPELKQSIMAKLQGGAVWKQFLDSVYSINTVAENSNTYNIGVGSNSVKAVIGVDRVTAGSVGLLPLQIGNFALNGFENVRVQYDGKLINNFDINTDATAYAELNRSLHSMFDSNITSCLAKRPAVPVGAGPATDLVISKFAWGVSSQAVNDSSIGFSGMPAQMLTIQHFNNGGANRTAFQYVSEGFVANRQRLYFILYDELLTIDGNGVCALVR
jgi:hypothetical protein